jgi:hypothetical protein
MVTPQMFVKVVSSGEQALVKGINEAFDGVVDVGGSGTFETIQAADDFLDGGAYALWVKQGTYAAGFTVSTNNAYISVEPGTVIEAAITLSGTGITLVLGAQCDIQGLITLSGANCSLICQGGVGIDGILASGNNYFIDGGGLDTLVDGGTARDAIDLTGTDGICQNIACQTTAGGASSFNGVEFDGVRSILRNVKVIDSDDVGIDALGADCLIEGCQILGADGRGILVGGIATRVVNNNIVATGGNCIRLDNSGSNAVIVGNITRDQAAGVDGISVHALAEDCVIVGNRVDDLGTGDGVVDGSGTSTVASNDETAF